MKQGARRRRQDKNRENPSWYDFIKEINTMPKFDHAVGGDEGFDAQEKKKEVKYRRRYGPCREQLEGRQI